MIYVNLGFPKTGSTMLQKNIYPFLKGISYLGKTWRRSENLSLFIEIDNFVQNKKEFSDSDLLRLINSFKEYCNYQEKILISQEEWLFPFTQNYSNNEIKLAAQETKLRKLIFFLEKSNVPYKFFFVKRDLETMIKSSHATLHDAISICWGENFINFEYFLNYINSKKKNYKSLLSLLYIFSFKEITKIIPKNKITLFDYNEIKNNKKKFINDLSNYLGFPINNDLVEKLTFQVRTTATKNKLYKFEHKNFLFKTIKLIIPQNLLNKVKFMTKFKFVKFLFFKKMLINDRKNILDKVIKEYF